tara:strand:+ start:323 stop:622 length:300 start_codon:yes stop_codon:yes gene_type:complete
MSILRHIRKIPLFSTPIEAIAWGRSRGLKGYHSHVFAGKTGYMSGANHRQAANSYVQPTPASQALVEPPITITPQPQDALSQPIVPPSTSNNNTGGSGY